MSQANHIKPKDRFNRRLKKLKEERTLFEPHWKELSNNILPRRGRFLFGEGQKGAKINGMIYDNTATHAHRTLVSGMMSGITSPARPWFRLTTDDPDLAENPAIKAWLADIERKMRDVFNRSNFYNSIHNVYEELSLFGTGGHMIYADHEDVIRCYAKTAGEYCLGVNHRLVVDTYYSEFKMTAWNLVREFGINNVSEEVKNKYINHRYDDMVDVIHAVEPNEGRKTDSARSDQMPFLSVFYEKSGDQDKLLRKSGFVVFPGAFARWSVLGTDIYGRSPAMETLGDIKQLQFETKRKSEGIDLMVRPPMQAPVELENQQIQAVPNGVTYVSNTGPGAGQGIRALYDTKPDLNWLHQDILEVQRRINEGFFADLFKMISTADPRNATAREIAERHEEKLILLGPMLERLHNELLDPSIDITFYHMQQRGMVPPPPIEVAEDVIQVEYISMLAQAQKAVGIGAVERLAGFVGNLSAVKPEILDKVDFDEMVDVYADNLGTPPKIVVADEVVRKVREARAKEMAEMKMMEQAGQLAQGAKVLSEVDTGGRNPIADALGTAA